MVFEPLKFGKPYNSITLNRFWNQVWETNPYGAGENPFAVKFARMWHKDAVIVSGDELVKAALGADNVGRFPYHRYWYQPTPFSQDKFSHHFNLSAGTYDFVVLCRTSSDSANVQWRVDGSIIGTTNLYDATGADLVKKTITSVTITTSGDHILQGQTFQRPLGSSDFSAYLYKYYFSEQ